MPPVSLPIASIFLRLDQLAFEQPALGHVGQRSGEFVRPALGVLEQHGLVVKMLVAAVGAAPAILDRETAGLLTLL